MHAIERRLISRFAFPDETRSIHLVPSGRGGVHLLQYSRGSLTRLAFGEDAVCHRLSLDERACSSLGALLGWGDDLPRGLERFFGRDEALLVDLVDICDRVGIPYGFCSMGGGTGTMVHRESLSVDGPPGVFGSS